MKLHLCTLDDPDQKELQHCVWCDRDGWIWGYIGGRCKICRFTDGGYGSFGSLWRSYNLKRRHVAKLMGLSPATVSKYSHGYPPRSAFERLIKLLDPLLSLREQKLKAQNTTDLL